MSPSENDTTTIDSYNKNAGAYAAKFMDFHSYREKVTRFHAQCIPKGAAILDLGCGPGNNAAILHSLDTTCRITGVDLSEEMIALARKSAPHGSFQVMDIREIDFPHAFDVIIASFCIVHLTDADTARLLRKISRHLKPGGSLYLSFMEGKEEGFETTSFSKDKIFFNYHNRETIKTQLGQCGLRVQEELSDGYEEEDGSITTDLFLFANKTDQSI